MSAICFHSLIGSYRLVVHVCFKHPRRPLVARYFAVVLPVLGPLSGGCRPATGPLSRARVRPAIEHLLRYIRGPSEVRFRYD